MKESSWRITKSPAYYFELKNKESFQNNPKALQMPQPNHVVEKQYLLFAVLSCAVIGSWKPQMSLLTTSKCIIPHQDTVPCQTFCPVLKEVVNVQFTLGLAPWKSWGSFLVLTVLSFLLYWMKVTSVFIIKMTTATHKNMMLLVTKINFWYQSYQ